jgi:Ca2+-binding EF-hand superfamily protein
MEVEYTVTENVHRNRTGQVVQIDYEFDETTIMDTGAAPSTGITRQAKEKRNRTYDATITRQQYETLAHQISNALSFDAFINVLRPFIMGFYVNDELEKAFNTLDRDRSGTIHLDELSSFLPILNDTVKGDVLRDYVRKVDENFDGTMNYDEFRTLVLRGIGRDIICNHL